MATDVIDKVTRITKNLYKQFMDEEEYSYEQVISRIVNELDDFIDEHKLTVVPIYVALIDQIKNEDDSLEQENALSCLQKEIDKICEK